MNGKAYLKSKTLWTNVLGFFLLVLPLFAELPYLAAYRAEIGIALAVANFGLRLVTNQPLVSKAEADATT